MGGKPKLPCPEVPALSLAPPADQKLSQLVASMPRLAGAELAAPRFVPMSWRPMQVFDAADDPDRTLEQWPLPQLGPREGPLKSYDLFRQHFRGASDSFATVIEGVLSEPECAALLRAVNAKGFTPVLLNIGGGRQQLHPEARDGHRVIVDAPEVAEALFARLKPHLPAAFSGEQLVELNERLRFLCYTPGQHFAEHYDASYVRTDGPRKGDASRLTVQVYLHTVPEAHGGATTFTKRSWPEGAPRGHQPTAGSVLVFTQDLAHEGSLVTDGVKYSLRTEAMYNRPGADNLALRGLRQRGVPV